MKRLWVILPLLFFFSCEDKVEKDTTPPELTISHPSSGSTIGEVVSIKVITIDNSGILKVDFYIDNTMMVSDTTSPYDYEWNTTTVSEGSHTIKVVSHDTKENFSEVELVVTVDNDSKKPSPLDILSVDYTVEKMTVKWNQSQESDFKQYNLYYCESENGTKILVKTITDKTITTYDTTSFDPHKENWYFLEVVDTFGLSNIGKGKTSIINLNPTQVEIDSINYSYDKQSFEIYWTQNSDNDFKSYTFYESENEDMSSKKELTVITDQSTNNYDSPINSGLVRYYQIVVEDNYGLKFTSNPKKGKSFIMFSKTLGGNNGQSVQQTNDGGYIVLVNSDLIKLKPDGKKEWDESIANNGLHVDITTDENYFVVGGKYVSLHNSEGKEIWKKEFPGVSLIFGQQTSDGGYIISGDSGTSFGTETFKGLLLKIDSSGNEVWRKTFGGSFQDGGGYLTSVKQTSDGGYIFTGENASYLLKTDSQGNQEWKKNYEGGVHGSSIGLTNDGGYILSGESFLVKTDSQGNQEWKNLFSSNYPQIRSIQQTIDRGYIYGGQEGQKSNIFLVKTDSQGNEVWRKYFGESSSLSSAIQTTDGGYIFIGYSYGNNGKSLLIKTDPEGNIK